MHLLQNQEMPCALQLCQIDICNTANFDIVQCKRSFHVYYTCALLKVSSTRIGCSFVHSDTQVGSTSGLGELNKDVAHLLDSFLKLAERRLWPADDHRMVSLRKTLYQFVHEKSSLLF